MSELMQTALVSGGTRGVSEAIENKLAAPW